jgi:hypothetical protein
MVGQITHDNVALMVQCNTKRTVELSVPCTAAAKGAQEARPDSSDTTNTITTAPHSNATHNNAPQPPHPPASSTSTSTSTSASNSLKPAPTSTRTRRPWPPRRCSPQTTARLAPCNTCFGRCGGNLHVSQQLRLLLQRALQLPHARALQLSLQLRSLLSNGLNGGFGGGVDSLDLHLQLLRAPVPQLQPSGVHISHTRYNGSKLPRVV